jgi:predicted PurR-regulated permease PerM
MNGRYLTWGALVLLGLGLGYASYLVLAPFFSEIFLAVVLAIVFHPAYEKVCRWTGRPGLSAWICTLATGVLFLLPVTMIGVVISREAKHAMDALSAAIGPSGNFEWFDRFVVFLSQQLGWDAGQTKEFLQSRLAGLSSSLLSNAVRSLQGLGSWVFSSVITLVTLFFLFRDGAEWLEASKDWVPLPRRMMDALYAETRVLMFANVYGVIVVALAQGALTGIGFAICGLPSALFWGALAAMFSILPLVGAGIVWLPGVLYLASSGDLMWAGILLGWGVLVVSMADNIIRPIVLSESAQMNTAVMFFALLGGIDAFGLIGLFAGPIVFSLAIAVGKLLREASAALGMKSEIESANP